MTLPKTNIDWFAYRTKDTPDVILGTMREYFPSKYNLWAEQRSQGWRSFEKAADIYLGDDPENAQRIGMLMTGGEAVKGWTLASLSGDGCAWVTDWGRAMDCSTEELKSFELKRVDVALDRFDGSHWEDVDAAWKAGDFAPPGGGKFPKAKPIDSRRPEDGRTYYVGSRESAKFYRGYEKGMQILGPQICAAQAREGDGFDLAHWLLKDDIRVTKAEDGQPALQHFKYTDWWRDEVEFKPVNQALPLDLVENRDQYFAGAYPYLGKVLPSVESQPLITRRERMPQLELAKLLEIVKTQYGNSLYTALHAYHGDIGAVWDRIVGSKHNRALVNAGVLLVDHE